MINRDKKAVFLSGLINERMILKELNDA